MQVRIVHRIAAPDWSYAAGEIVSIGARFAPGEIPADVAKVWLSTGQVESIPEPLRNVETAALKRNKGGQ